MKRVFVLCISILLLFGFYMCPSTVLAGVCKTNTAIVFSNGMFTTKRQARDGLVDSLRKKVSTFPQAALYVGELKFYLAYANNDGATTATGLGIVSGIVQLHEAFVQKQAATYSMFWRWAGGLPGAPAWFSTLMQDIAATVNATAYVKDADLQKQLLGDPANLTLQPGYRALLNQGMRVVIVAHSQGNFYANRAYDALVAQKPEWANNVGIVAVASPDTRIASPNGLHVTAIEDVVIAALWPNTLAANATNTTAGGNTDLWGHSFVGSYLNGNDTRPMILNDIVTIRQQLQPSIPNMVAQIVLPGSSVGPDPNGGVYISQGGSVKKVEYAEDGTATVTNISGVPQVDHVGPDGSLYYSNADTIYKVNPAGTPVAIYSTAGGVPVNDFDVADDGSVYVAQETMVFWISPTGIATHVAGKPIVPRAGTSTAGTTAVNWYVNFASNVKAGNNGRFYFATGMAAAWGGEIIIPADTSGNVWTIQPGWATFVPQHQWDEGYDVCPNGDLLNARGGGILRYSYSGASDQVATGVNSNSIFEWSQTDDTVYFVDPATGSVNRLVPSPN